MVAIGKFAEAMIDTIAERMANSNQPKNGGGTTPSSYRIRPKVCPGISIALADFFYAGGSWQPMGAANATDLQQIQAGNVQVKTGSGQIGYVSTGSTTSTAPRPMLRR